MAGRGRATNQRRNVCHDLCHSATAADESLAIGTLSGNFPLSIRLARRVQE